MRNIKTMYWTTALMLIVPGAFAEETTFSYVCIFQTECLTGEDCSDTNYMMSIDLKEVSKSPITTVVDGSFTTISESWRVTGFYNEGVVALSGGGMFPASHHITIDAEGSALYTTHVSAELGISYLGNCS